MASNTGRFNLTTVKFYWLSLLLSTVVFLLPTNLFLSFFRHSAYVTGIFSDYLVVKWYLSEMVLWVYLISIALTTHRNWRAKLSRFRWYFSNNIQALVVLLLCTFLVIRQLFSSHPLIGLWNLFQWFEVLLLLFAWFFHWRLSKQRFVQTIRAAIIVTLLFQSVIGLGQYLRQTSWFGYRFFGEPSFALALNLAKTTRNNGEELILPYGTTAHPNLLGGYLAVCISILVWTRHKAGGRIQLMTQRLSIILGSLTLWFTHSFTSIMVVATGLMLRYLQPVTAFRHSKKLFLLIGISATVLLVPFAHQNPSNSSLSRRIWLGQASYNMFKDRLLFGVGVGQFTTALIEHTDNQDVWHFLQPVHSAFWLLLSETGLLGSAIALGLWTLLDSSHQKRLLSLGAVLFVPLVFDHYLVTLQPGRWLLALALIGLVISEKTAATASA